MVINHFQLLGVNVAVTNLSLTTEFIEQKIAAGEKAYICIAPVSTIVDCQNSEKYKKIINQAGLTTPDGMPLVWIGRRRGNENIDRTYGPDLLPYVCQETQAKGYRHFFYGGTKETSQKLVKRLQHIFPSLNIVGAYAPDFIDHTTIESAEILDLINKARPDILWVGLGSPKQDYWMAAHRDKLNVSVMIGVGAAFDFIAGTKPQAPRWMRRAGLEWLFRLVAEPRRLWKRYLFGNTQFLYLLFLDLFKPRKQKDVVKV